MTSKEALRYFVALVTLNFDKEGAKRIGIIKKDLKVLEILRKHSTRLDDEDWNSNIFNGIDYENLNEKERKVIKEWLEERKGEEDERISKN